MKEINLSQGKVAFVDDEDYDKLIKFKWFAHKHRNTYYARCNNRGNPIKMHRLILEITDPDITIDHKDLNGLNNQKYNLRKCSNSQNQANRPKRKFSKSKFKGVTTSPVKINKWKAQIKKNGKVMGLGSYKTEEDAAKAYDKAALEIHGEFANLNFK